MQYLQKITLFILMLWSISLNGQHTTMTDFSLAYNLGAYNRAAALGEELLLRKSIQNDVNAWFSLSTKLGIAYHSIGNYERGLERLEAAIDWARTEGNYPVGDLLLAYYEKGKILEELEQYSTAQFILLKAVQLFENNKTLQKDKNAQLIYLHTLMGLGSTAYSKTDYSKAKLFFEKALKYNQVTKIQEASLLAQQHLYLGKVEEKLGHSDLAGAQILLAIEMGKMEIIEQSVLWSTFYHDLADYYIECKRNTEALKYNSLAIKSLLPTWKNEAKDGLPTVEELNQSTSLGLAAQLLAQRGAIYFDNKNTATELKKALENYRLMDIFVTRLRRLYTGESARLLWSDRALDFYEKAIKCCLSLHKKTGENSYQLEAFVLSERSKSLLLLEAFKKIKAKKVAGVPVDKIEKEEQLEEEVDALENQLYNLKRYKQNTESFRNKLRTKEKELLEKRRAYEDFLIELRKQYPAYYKLKFDLTVATVPEVQARLAKDQLLIEYFIGSDELIAFKINKQAYEVLELPLDFELTPKIKAFREGIYAYYLNNENRSDSLKKSYVEQYQSLGYELYQAILEPILEGQKEHRLMIILAGNLGFLPFEALLTAATKGDNFREMPYLLKDYAVGYCYSATLLHEMQSKEHISDKIFLGFAPEFKQGAVRGNYTFNPLIHSQTEVNEIFDLVGEGEVFNGEVATKENFQANCEDYCILHIATHGVMNTQNSENSFLAFSEVPGSNDNELLYVRDLYNMHLTASLVVLSACETGIGGLYESEGIASLARGFSYAGAKSLITSLWSVNDHATAEIMRRLYANLKIGLPKDQALQQAKVDFIQSSSNRTAHPFLWSAFIQIGDEAPLPRSEGEGAWLWWLGGGLLVVLLLLLVVGLNRRKG